MRASNIEGQLPLYTVYHDTRDYPGEYVVRRTVLVPGGGMRVDRDLFARGPSLDAVRLALPAGLTCLPAVPADDPVIVEVWL